MTAQNIRYKYTDSNGDDQVVASTVGSGAEIDHVQQIRNFRDVNKVKIWGGRGLFNSFPQQKTSFNGAEPEILMQEEVDGTWTTVGRFFAKDSGDIKDKESVAVTLYGFQRYVEKQDISISNTTSDIVDVAQKLPAEIEGSYTVEVPAEADVDGGYPSVDGYSYSGKAESFIQELSRDYKWTFLFTDRVDSNGDKVIRFEPQGFGGAVDTLDSNTIGLKFDDWEKERTENIVNKVTVQGVDSNGNKVDATAKNQDMIDKYGVKFERVHLKYVESSSDAQEIAEERLKPGKDSNGNDITSPPEGGIVNLPTLTFRQGIENDSVNVVDSDLNIDDSFTVSKHKLFYPSGRSELHLDFEDENLEERASKDKFLGDRNASLFTESQTDVGNQNVDADTENVDDSYDDFGSDDHGHVNSDSTSEAGQIQFEDAVISTASEVTLNDEDNTSVSASVLYPGNAFQITYKLNTDAGFGAEFIVQISINGAVSESFVTKTNNGGNIEGRFAGLENISGDTVEFLVVNKSGGSVTVQPELGLQGEATHDHDVPVSDTDNNTTGGNNQTNSSDSNAGDTTSLNASGSTDSKNINTASEEKTDR